MRTAAMWGLIMACLVPRLASAQDTVDRQLWLQVLATVRLSENWRLHLEEWPRLSEDASGPFQIITRAAMGRRLNNRATLWGGVAWVAKPPGPGVTHERRIWEQLSVTLPAASRWTPSVRVRLEQRFQDGWADNSHRLRMMGRAVRPLNERRSWSLVGWDEVFVTFDDTEGGPWRGLDQNRLFGGVLRQFNPKVGLELGYLWTTSQAPDKDRTHAHVAFVWLNLAL
jgi:Protein of unknown function (DUF2490)